MFILLPDGVGLRNFAFTDFYGKAKNSGFDVVFWNHSAFDLSQIGLPEIKLHEKKPHRLTDILKWAKIAIELNRNIEITGDDVYDSYRFPPSGKDLKSKIRRAMIRWYTFRYSSKNGLERLQKRMESLERTTPLYRESMETLRLEKPDLIFCTNQRPVLAISPLRAAKDLGIPVSTFIFSWDNLPKATKVIEADHYFVWSEHMKRELLFYYPNISDRQIAVTGTPQFESHFNQDLREDRETFFAKHDLDLDRNYICYSGDDVNTSPHDPRYLSDVAAAVRELNANGNKLGIVFRRCPTDFSTRFDKVLNENADIITSIAPAWAKMGDVWNMVLPTAADMALLSNTIAHTEMVVNLGSSMVFDYAAFGKPCAFMNYDPIDNPVEGWSVKKIYEFVHFKSMPDAGSVIWLDNPGEIARKLGSAIRETSQTVAHANDWFSKINQQPATEASIRIVNELKSLAGCI
ncbi:UDP-glycosyltransferase [Flavobacterium sp.]|uniref:UDP-glycosyltransferase n=1 Tax=Flavobacterium sp. TaxID=239 RepID=UPI0025C357A1|nr:UDP-glycosyltransferase [Flavobacterium sp.]